MTRSQRFSSPPRRNVVLINLKQCFRCQTILILSRAKDCFLLSLYISALRIESWHPNTKDSHVNCSSQTLQKFRRQYYIIFFKIKIHPKLLYTMLFQVRLNWLLYFHDSNWSNASSRNFRVVILGIHLFYRIVSWP